MITLAASRERDSAVNHRDTITALITAHPLHDVPGYARQNHGIIITHEDVRAVYLSLPASQIGRTKAQLGACPKPPPDDFATHAAAEFNDDLAERYNVGISTVSRWRRETGIRPPEHRKAKPMPQGFAAVARDMGNHELELRYSVGIQTVKRWRAECGVPLAPRAPKLLPFKQNAYTTAPVDRPHRDDSTAGQAADFLRHFGPVIRCGRDGRYDPNGDRWRRGSALLTADEVIERAEFNGWRADDWRRVA